MDNVHDLNDVRRIRNIERDIKMYERQLADIKKTTTILEVHKEFYFFSVTCYAMQEEKKRIAAELVRLRLRLDRSKNPEKYKFNGDTDEQPIN